MSTPTNKHPRELYALFFTEMWERFSFYLLIGILYQYLTDSVKGGAGWDGVRASSIVGTYSALVYFTPLIGGLIADRLLGQRRAIVIGGVFMMIGHVVLAFPQGWALYIGLLCVVIGNGFFKPNISTLVGNLYPPGSPLKDAGYNIFYMGINLGAFVCNFVAAIVRNRVDQMHDVGITGWHAAFGTAGVGMLIGLVVFITNYKRFAPYESLKKGAAAESLTPLWVQCLTPAALAAGLGAILASTFEWGLGPITVGFLFACVPVLVFYWSIWRSLTDPREKSRTAALYTVFGVVIVFWIIFYQTNTALNDWAIRDTDRVPTSIVRPIVDLAPDFAEEAPLDYYFNAGPEVLRPPKDRYVVVSDAEQAEFATRNELMTPDHRLRVTKAQLDGIFSPQTSASDAPAALATLANGETQQLVNAELYQSINPGFIILFTPLIVVPFFAFLRRRGKEPSTPAKIVLGLFITALAPLIMLFAVLATHDGHPKASSWWLFGTYAMVTLGELCLSPMGLSLVSKASPAKLRAFMMGGWFLATSIGAKLSGVFGEFYQQFDHAILFGLTTAFVLASAGVLFALLPKLRTQFGDIESAD